jgi:hypothetical protein
MSDQPNAEPIPVGHVLAMMIDQVSDLGWQRMGLRADMMTGKIEKDLDQAKLAIDACSQLADLLIPHLDDEDKRQMQNLVRDLRVNYVEKSQG